MADAEPLGRAEVPATAKPPRLDEAPTDGEPEDHEAGAPPRWKKRAAPSDQVGKVHWSAETDDAAPLRQRGPMTRAAVRRSRSVEAVGMRPEAEFDDPLDRCPLCESPAIAWFDRDAWDVHIFGCRRCGTRFMNPQYSDEALQRFYRTYITRYEPKQDERRRERRRRQKERTFALIDRFTAPGRMLSIGSGDGLELEVARRRGWSVVGHDLDPRSTADIRARSGIEVLSGPLLEHSLQDGAFDCVVMDHVLEHLRNPADYLRRVRRLLRPGGILYIGVPNTGSIAAEWQRWMGRFGLKRRTRGRHYDTGHHVLYFTPAVLTRVLERWFGFDMLLVQGDPKAGRRGPATVVADWLRTKLPVLDSSMRIVARVRP